jgi:hypothetical protein
VIPSLERGRVPKFQRPDLARQLRLAPWCWPPEGHPRLAFAQEISASEVPIGLSPGIAPGVTVWREQAVTLWRVEIDDGSVRSEATLSADARQAWENAGCALPRSVPVLWESVRATTQRSPVLSRIESFAHSGTAILESAIDGPSFGLTFGLVLSSRVFGLPLPADLAASAALDANGRVQSVDGLAQKIAGLLALAPRITRLIVAEAQREDAKEAAGDTLDVFGVRTLGEALTIVF